MDRSVKWRGISEVVAYPCHQATCNGPNAIGCVREGDQRALSAHRGETVAQNLLRQTLRVNAQHRIGARPAGNAQHRSLDVRWDVSGQGTAATPPSPRILL